MFWLIQIKKEEFEEHGVIRRDKHCCDISRFIYFVDVNTCLIYKLEIKTLEKRITTSDIIYDFWRGMIGTMKLYMCLYFAHLNWQ